MNEPQQRNKEHEQLDGWEDIEPTRWDRVRAAIKWLVAAVAVLGLIYLSGIYQGFSLSRTSEKVVQEPVPSVLNEPRLLVPLEVFILTGDGELGSTRSEENIEQLVENADAIWHQADIELEIVAIHELALTDEVVAAFAHNPRDVIAQVEPNGEVIRVFLAQTLAGINGISFGGLKSVAVADFTSVNDYRTLAHEIGHQLGLPHVPGDRSRLLFRGANGVELSRDEILTAREHALQLKLEQ